MGDMTTETTDALAAATLRAEKAERERDEALASERLERNRANGWRSQAATIREEAVADAPILSKYHGQRGFEVERFIADYEAWKLRALSPTAPGQETGK
jgi:hypothetical protein